MVFRFSRYPGNEVARTNLILIGLVFILFFAWEFRNKIDRLFPVLTGIAWITLTSIMIHHEPMSVNVFYQCISVVIFSLTMVKICLSSDERTTKIVIDAMIVGALIQSFFCIADFVFQNIFYEEILIKLFKISRSTESNVWFLNGESFASVGTLGGVARTAGYISICSSAFWKYLPGTTKKLKTLSMTGIIISFLAVLAVKSTLGIASFLTVHFYLAMRLLLDKIKAKDNELLGFNLLFITNLFWSFYITLYLKPSFFLKYENERITNWIKIYETYKDAANKDKFAWLFGKGISWWQDIGWRVSGTKFFWEHNEQLSVLINFGILGTIIVWGGFFYALGTKERTREDSIFKASILAAIVLSFGHFVFHQGTITVVVMACFACLLRERKN